MGRRDPPNSYGVEGLKVQEGRGSLRSGDPAWRSPYGFDFVHVLIVAAVGVFWGG